MSRTKIHQIVREHTVFELHDWHNCTHNQPSSKTSSAQQPHHRKASSCLCTECVPRPAPSDRGQDGRPVAGLDSDEVVSMLAASGKGGIIKYTDSSLLCFVSSRSQKHVSLHALQESIPQSHVHDPRRWQKRRNHHSSSTQQQPATATFQNFQPPRELKKTSLAASTRSRAITCPPSPPYDKAKHTPNPTRSPAAKPENRARRIASRLERRPTLEVEKAR
ncbi:hypothetical protein EJ07DRAFT_157417 [Lizonia empirigonia]|nr:hypothetical protein EJ07DRAFT_157417 [Lizonia empirigonia]